MPTYTYVIILDLFVSEQGVVTGCCDHVSGIYGSESVGNYFANREPTEKPFGLTCNINFNRKFSHGEKQHSVSSISPSAGVH